VNITDSTGPMRRMSRALGLVISERAYRRSTKFNRGLPSLYGLFSWTLIATILLFMISGCGRYKEELESAKQQIVQLNSEVKRLTEETARLNEEKNRLGDESKALSDKNTQMQRELNDLNKAKAALSNENKEMSKKNSVADEEIASLKREKANLTKEIEELKKRVADMAAPAKPPAAVPTEGGPQSEKQPEELSPCDAVLAFMKASEGIVRQQQGPERAKALEQAHQQYAPRMKGAPQKAIKAAEDWVKEGTKYWDRSPDVALYRVLQLRNIALDACAKSPTQSGFK
jgi:DNA repair exonuclease SbcCD ATPase subunit